MRFLISILILALPLLASPARAEKANFPVAIAIEDFEAVFAATVAAEGATPPVLRPAYCRSEVRVACQYDWGEDLSIVVSGDESDNVIDLFSVNIAGDPGATEASISAVRAVVALTDPSLAPAIVTAELADLVATVIHRGDAITDSFATERVIYRLVLGPIQGTIFTATPR